MKKLITLLSLLIVGPALGQVVITSPVFPNPDSPVTITFDATQGSGGLEGYTGDVYIHTGVRTNLSTSPSDWRYVKPGTFGTNTETTRMTRLEGGENLYQITLGPSIREYYGVPETETITHVAMVFRSEAQVNGSWLEGKAVGNQDIFVEMASGEFQMALVQPASSGFLVNNGETIDIRVETSSSADFTMLVDGEPYETAEDVTTFLNNYTVTQTSGTHEVVISATDGVTTLEVDFSFTLRSAVENAEKPAGIKRGINYHDGDDTRVTLCLQAPNKSSVYVLGDFNDWSFSSDYLMKKDGELFWLEITGLTQGQEYAFQYVVDESIYIADPYCDKILNPLDQYIPEDIYPNLKPFPENALNAVGFYNTVSVLETGQAPFEWTDGEFQKPPKENLVVYELLVRDFFKNGDESYKNLTDTLSYIKSLGVNAIELMPITEYSGNDSWGYNPTFMLAVDKAHGPKEELKNFINTAHEMGMAVILDVVLNQQEQPSPLILLDFNVGTSQVTPENPYFNVTATHPFNVFYDMNHESSYTQSFVDTVNHYWINEYHFDGYRFDLSKGFTQTNYGDNVENWSNYDAGRINILKRMADEIWSHTPDAYVILEHFAANNEETELANYGMMLWGNIHGPYKDNILGTSHPDLRWAYHGARGWNNPHAIAYMESHDEERQMYEALNFGGSFGTYNVRNVNNALERMKLASAFLYGIPGPKMLWQFGELGYDISINQNGRTGQKPNPWDNSESRPYYLSTARQKLLKTTAELIKLKVNHNVFTSGNYSIVESTLSSIKQITLANPSNTVSPSSAEDMSVVIVGNFGLQAVQATMNVPFSGATWYHYFDQNKPLTFAGTATSFSLQPGEFRVYTNFALTPPETELYENLTPLAPSGLAVQEVTTGVSLTWTNHSTINDGNYIYRRLPAGEWTNIGQVARTSATYTDTNVQNDVTYEYRVGAYTAVGETFSNEEQILVENVALSVSESLQRALYPNPASGKVTLRMDGEEPLYYFLYDLNGRQALKGKFREGDFSIDLSGQPTGLYVVEIITRAGARHLAKVVKE